MGPVVVDNKCTTDLKRVPWSCSRHACLGPPSLLAVRLLQGATSWWGARGKELFAGAYPQQAGGVQLSWGLMLSWLENRPSQWVVVTQRRHPDLVLGGSSNSAVPLDHCAGAVRTPGHKAWWLAQLERSVVSITLSWGRRSHKRLLAAARSISHAERRDCRRHVACGLHTVLTEVQHCSPVQAMARAGVGLQMHMACTWHALGVIVPSSNYTRTNLA